MRRHTALRLNERDREMLEKIARKYDITLSDVLRIAIKEFLEKNETKLKEGTT
jgi:replication initiation and membrane attachment protein DnaB